MTIEDLSHNRLIKMPVTIRFKIGIFFEKGVMRLIPVKIC